MISRSRARRFHRDLSREVSHRMCKLLEFVMLLRCSPNEHNPRCESVMEDFVGEMSAESHARGFSRDYCYGFSDGGDDKGVTVAVFRL